MKKLFVAAALFLALSFTSCQKQSVDSVIERIQACETIDDFNKLNDDKELNEYIESLSKEDQAKIYEAASEKVMSLLTDDLGD